MHNTTNAFDATISDLQSYKMQLDQQLIENVRLRQSIKLLQGQLDGQHKAHADYMQKVTETHRYEVERLRTENEQLRTKLQKISDSSNVYYANDSPSSDANAYLSHANDEPPARPKEMRNAPPGRRGTSHGHSILPPNFY